MIDVVFSGIRIVAFCLLGLAIKTSDGGKAPKPDGLRPFRRVKDFATPALYLKDMKERREHAQDFDPPEYEGLEHAERRTITKTFDHRDNLQLFQKVDPANPQLSHQDMERRRMKMRSMRHILKEAVDKISKEAAELPPSQALSEEWRKKHRAAVQDLQKFVMDVEKAQSPNPQRIPSDEFTMRIIIRNKLQQQIKLLNSRFADAKFDAEKKATKLAAAETAAAPEEGDVTRTPSTTIVERLLSLLLGDRSFC